MPIYKSDVAYATHVISVKCLFPVSVFGQTCHYSNISPPAVSPSDIARLSVDEHHIVLHYIKLTSHTDTQTKTWIFSLDYYTDKGSSASYVGGERCRSPDMYVPFPVLKL